VVTLALNVADPLIAGDYGKAAFDAVGLLLLIGWAEVGPDLLRALTTTGRLAAATPDDAKPEQAPFTDEPTRIGPTVPEWSREDATPDGTSADRQSDRPASRIVDDELLERAREEDARHWDAHRRPISADTLWKKLRIGAARSRLLVAMIRADSQRSAQAEVTAQAGVSRPRCGA
jgi:hypothetical protein